MTEESVCPKCGGKMVNGHVMYLMRRASQGSMFPMGNPTPGLEGLTDMAVDEMKRFIWHEKTGERKGFIFKRDETREMGLEGYRCTVCNFIELYAKED
ncbi:MAG TPA: PF20097 family protein [Patescibacteria group bacterium]|nr:PF20097 family protein [Patescibacteria group bacterium]